MTFSTFRNILRNPAVRVPVTIAIFMVVAATVILTYSYNNQLNQYREAELTRLNAIAITLAQEIDGDVYEKLLDEFTVRDQITCSNHNPVYHKIHNMLQKAQQNNGLDTDIYTLFWDDDKLFFGVTSGKMPYYRHQWNTDNPIYLDKYDVGGMLGPYEDDNGTWLSAFVPIKNSDNQTISVLQVDEQFDRFIDRVQADLVSQLLIVLVIFIIVIILLYHNVRLLLRKEEIFKRRLEYHSELIEQKNKDITDSLHSAKNIQKSLLPADDVIRNCFAETALVFMPRDIVSGDFFWLNETDKFVYLAVADCTGHGVPGGFMSMIGQTALNEIIDLQPELNCGDILRELNVRVKKLIRHSSSDGMDIGLCRFEKGTTKVMFAGANRPLYISGNGESNLVKGDRQGINGYLDPEHIFATHELQLNSGECIYLFSDGYQDQFGGARGKKFMRKQLCTLLDKICTCHMTEQEKILKNEFHEWRGGFDQVDDVLIWGIRIS
ncbi:MAG: SpoIIE family protein phosphatase [Cryomorphaceae bacterium]|nr:SpoIIE family protein phosphatase [Cryomorphaceae bacterium]